MRLDFLSSEHSIGTHLAEATEGRDSLGNGLSSQCICWLPLSCSSPSLASITYFSGCTTVCRFLAELGLQLLCAGGPMPWCMLAEGSANSGEFNMFRTTPLLDMSGYYSEELEGPVFCLRKLVNCKIHIYQCGWGASGADGYSFSLWETATLLAIKCSLTFSLPL